MPCGNNPNYSLSEFENHIQKFKPVLEDIEKLNRTGFNQINEFNVIQEGLKQDNFGFVPKTENFLKGVEPVEGFSTFQSLNPLQQEHFLAYTNLIISKTNNIFGTNKIACILVNKNTMEDLISNESKREGLQKSGEYLAQAADRLNEQPQILQARNILVSEIEDSIVRAVPLVGFTAILTMYDSTLVSEVITAVVTIYRVSKIVPLERVLKIYQHFVQNGGACKELWSNVKDKYIDKNGYKIIYRDLGTFIEQNRGPLLVVTSLVIITGVSFYTPSTETVTNISTEIVKPGFSYKPREVHWFWKEVGDNFNSITYYIGRLGKDAAVSGAQGILDSTIENGEEHKEILKQGAEQATKALEAIKEGYSKGIKK